MSHSDSHQIDFSLMTGVLPGSAAFVSNAVYLFEKSGVLTYGFMVGVCVPELELPLAHLHS